MDLSRRTLIAGIGALPAIAASQAHASGQAPAQSIKVLVEVFERPQNLPDLDIDEGNAYSSPWYDTILKEFASGSYASILRTDLIGRADGEKMTLRDGESLRYLKSITLDQDGKPKSETAELDTGTTLTLRIDELTASSIKGWIDAEFTVLRALRKVVVGNFHLQNPDTLHDSVSRPIEAALFKETLVATPRHVIRLTPSF